MLTLQPEEQELAPVAAQAMTPYAVAGCGGHAKAQGVPVGCDADRVYHTIDIVAC